MQDLRERDTDGFRGILCKQILHFQQYEHLLFSRYSNVHILYH